MHQSTSKRGKPYVAALRLLAARRLTEAQLWTRLTRRGYASEEVRGAVELCKHDGYLDDRLFAQLFVDGRVKAVGDARLVAELVGRGVDRTCAQSIVACAERTEEMRLSDAVGKLFRTRPEMSFPSAARALERLGFSATAIYRRLRTYAAATQLGRALSNSERVS